MREKAIAKLIGSLGHTHRTSEVFSDFCALTACAISNKVYIDKYDEREAEYMRVIGKYKKEHADIFPRLLAEVIEALEEDMQDILGHVFMQLELGNKNSGQFFTPYELCVVMAKMTVGDKAQIEEVIAKQGHMGLLEPAIGGGATVIATAQALRDEGVNYQQSMHVVGIDVDLRSVQMAYIQLSLLHVPAVLIHGNTLSGEEWSRWYTPAHVLGKWEERMAVRKFIERVNDLIGKGENDVGAHTEGGRDTHDGAVAGAGEPKKVTRDNRRMARVRQGARR